MTALRGAAVAAAALAMALAGLRWLRVAQREHYLAGSAGRFALRWWRLDPFTVAGALLAGTGVVLSYWWPATAFVTALIVAAGPPGLGLRGRSAPLAWTRRLRTLAAVAVVLGAAGMAAGVLAGLGPVVAGALAVLTPVVVDLAAALTGPFEKRAAGRHVARARSRLARVSPRVIAITGSYGKTGTKGYVAHLIGGARTVLASPASFNNRAGLARAVNENLVDGTDVFVAEMGTYGPGEIAELCSWLRPDIALITAIGPVHLERFGTEDRILTAKAEILDGARVGILNVDDPRLAALADARAGTLERLLRVSATDPTVDVAVLPDPGDEGGNVLVVAGLELARGPAGSHRGNAAAAVAAALEAGVAADEIARRFASLPTAPHRLEAGTGAGGVLVLDDTYNANPAGARAALDLLAELAPAGGRRVVVTPGMVELGPAQAGENALFGRAVAEQADHLLIVGRTNRRALLHGAGEAPPEKELDLLLVRHRPEAVAWVRQHLGPGDVVLYENDLPDHYP